MLRRFMFSGKALNVAFFAVLNQRLVNVQDRGIWKEITDLNCNCKLNTLVKWQQPQITSGSIKVVEKCIEKFFRGLIAKPLTRATIQFIGKMQHIGRTIVFNRNTLGDILA